MRCTLALPEFLDHVKVDFDAVALLLVCGFTLFITLQMSVLKWSRIYVLGLEASTP